MNKQYKKALVMLFIIMSCFMLSSATKSPYYTRNVIITRIYPHKLGYKVFYMTNDLNNKEIYLPNELFDTSDSSKIFFGKGKAYPYMQIFWKDGEFSFVKLYLKEDFRDITWGSFNNPDDHDESFKNADLVFKF